MTTPTPTPTPTVNGLDKALAFEAALDLFLRSLEAKNRSAATIQAYRTDLTQFISFLHQSNLVVTGPVAVTKTDIIEYLAHLGQQGIRCAPVGAG